LFYNYLIYLLVVIFILATNSIPETPPLSARSALLLFAVKGLLYYLIIRRAHAPRRISRSSQYFAVEQRLAILAIASLAVDVYLLDCQYYFTKLPMAGTLPTITNMGCMLLFFGYLSLMWTEARRSYAVAFGRTYSARSFAFSNLRANLPVILPWALLSLFSDLLQTSSMPAVRQFLASPWGEPALFLLLFFILALIFPAIITRLWGCTPLPPGPMRERIEAFCRSQNLAYADIMLWPLFEGRMLTAGVMGLTRRFRYLLITPGLLQTMTAEEINAVLAHEIGHVKRYHLQLYMLFFMGFLIFAELSTYPTLYLLLNSDTFYRLLRLFNREPAHALTFVSVVPIFILMIVYFRYIFGFFMRNFERQADLHVFSAMPDCRPLVQVLEKIAWLSGNIRDLPNWHHFGIGERVRFLISCHRDQQLIKRHDRKVRAALVLFVLALGTGGILLWKIPGDLLDGAPREKFAQAVLEQKIRQEPRTPLWHQLLGDLQQKRHRYGEAAVAYEHALALTPDNPELLNNFAWLLLTAEPPIRDPGRALPLAEKAAALNPTGYILDTLAHAQWATGDTEGALATELKALARDPANAAFYHEQLELLRRPPEN